MAQARAQRDMSVRVAWIGAIATLGAALIAGLVTLVESRDKSERSNSLDRPAATASSGTVSPPPGSADSPIAGPGDSVPPVDATGATVHEILTFSPVAKADFDTGPPWTMDGSVSAPGNGQDLGHIGSFLWSGIDAGIVQVRPDTKLDAGTCISASGYVEGILSPQPETGSAYCLRSTEGRIFLLVADEVPRRSDSNGQPIMGIYSWK
jgi:hypothetical protein